MEFFNRCYSLPFFSSCLTLVMMIMLISFVNSSSVDQHQANEPTSEITSLRARGDDVDDTMEYYYLPTKMTPGGDLVEKEIEGEVLNDGAAAGFNDRRSLFWQGFKHLYISYGALSSDRIPCPPRSGRSYYTHNCYFADGPVHPYVRGCSTITRCRR